jgi:phosphoglycerate dehydrogenase-like enzyme
MVGARVPGSGDVPDDVAEEAEFVMAAASQRVDKTLLGRAPGLRMIQIPGHGFDHVDLDACLPPAYRWACSTSSSRVRRSPGHAVHRADVRAGGP